MANRLDEGAADNLPSVDSDMILDFFMNNVNYVSAECRNVKSLRALRKEYGDNAIAYVQLKRDGSECIVKGRISPEHKIHNQYYSVSVVVNEAEDIVSRAVCHSCAAAPTGTCKHSAAFLMWLHRKSEEPSVTSTECYWKTSRLSRIFKDIKFITLQGLTGKRKRQFSEEKGNAFREKFLKSISGVQNCTIVTMNSPSPYENISIHQMAIQYKTQNTPEARTADGFLTFMRNHMTDEKCLHMEKTTREQSNCEEWFEMRYGRITASNAHEASRCKTMNGVLTGKIMGAPTFNPTKTIERGRHLEAEVLKQVAKVKNLQIKPCGILLSRDKPILGASPDGITNEYVLEVKCPSKKETIKNFIENGVIKEKPLSQILMQMCFAHKKKGLFCVASPDFETSKLVEIQEVPFDEAKCQELMTSCVTF